MLECQAYALEDIMQQKKHLAVQIKQTTAKKTAKKRQRSFSANSPGKEKEVVTMETVEDEKTELRQRKHEKDSTRIGAGVRHFNPTAFTGYEEQDNNNQML